MNTFNNKEYRVATPADYQAIIDGLQSGDAERTLVRQINKPHVSPFPLLEISQGPYTLTENGLEGFSKSGEKCFVKISDSPLKNVILKEGDGDWYPPELGSVVLLI
jgi:hypothetical protein